MPEKRKQETFKSLKFKWCHLSLDVIKWIFLETKVQICLRIFEANPVYSCMAFAVLSHILCKVSDDSIREQKHLIWLYRGGSRITYEVKGWGWGLDLIKCPYLPYVFGKTGLSKQCRLRSDAGKCGVWSGSTLFATYPAIFITKTRLFKFILKISPPKTENLQIKNSDIFHISAENIDCGYSLEPPRRGGSNEY